MSECICPYGRPESSYGQGNCPMHDGDTPSGPAETSVNPPRAKVGEFLDRAIAFNDHSFDCLTKPCQKCQMLAAEFKSAYAAGRAASGMQPTTVEQLAQIICEVDGGHDLSAGEMAEGILQRCSLAAPATAQLSEGQVRAAVCQQGWPDERWTAITRRLNNAVLRTEEAQ